MKKHSKLYRLLIGAAILTGLLYAGETQGQAPEGYYGPTVNTGYASHGVGTGTNAFNLAAGGTYDAFGFGIGTDAFIGPGGVAGVQEITGTVAPNFDTLAFSNGGANAFNITNTAGIVVNGRLTFSNGITTTLRASRAAGLAGAIRFSATGTYLPALTPAAGADARFVDGYVSKVNPAAFVYPVGNGTDLRTITATGTGTFATAWSTTGGATVYTGALAPTLLAIATNGYWEWSGTAAATVTISIPDETGLVIAPGLTIAGYNGTTWTDLGGVFATNTENTANTAAVSVPANIVALAVASKVPVDMFVNVKAFLQGPLSGSTMTTTLNTLGLIPTHQPYNIAPFNYAGLDSVPAGFFAAHTDIVDWVLVELRDPASPSTVFFTRAAFLRNDGVIVDTSGTATFKYKSYLSSYYIVVRHRNHMGMRSTSPVALGLTNAVYDFSSGAAQANSTNATKNVGGIYCMWAGNVNGDGRIYNTAAPSDAAAIVSAVAGRAGNVLNLPAYTGFTNVYNIYDVNLDGKVYNNASPSDKAIVVANVAANPANAAGLANSTLLVEKLP